MFAIIYQESVGISAQIPIFGENILRAEDNMYDWGSLITSINNLEIGGNISSTVASKLTAAKTAMENTIEDYKNSQ